MLEQFFITGPIPANTEQGSYNLLLVALSYIVASIASYLALVLARKLAGTQSTFGRRLTHWGGSLALGAGIWSMHFIGMLAFRMDMPMGYDPVRTILSLLVAIISAYGVLTLVSGSRLSRGQLISGAVIAGSGICSMHYIGMWAMIMDCEVRYRPDIFALSVFIAIAASAAALWISFTLARREGRWKQSLVAGAALVMGAAICGMHYTGMEAAVFLPHHGHHTTMINTGMSGVALTVAITGVVLSIILPFLVYSEIREDTQGQAMASVFPTRLLTMSVLLTFAALAWVAGYSFYTNRILIESVDRNQVVSDSSYKLGVARTRMQVNLRMAVNSGEARWREAYKQAGADFDRALRDIRNLALGTDISAPVRNVDNARRLLEQIQMQLLTMLREGRPEEARRLIDAPPYQTLTASLLDKTQALSQVMATEASTGMHVASNGLYYMGTGIAIVALLLMGSWYHSLHSISMWRRELREARNRAETANATKSDFLANMSHELRTPLNSILGMTRLLLESPLDSHQQEAGRIVFQSSTHLLDIVNDILDLSKIESGQMQLEHIGMDLKYILMTVISVLEPLAKEKGLRFIHDSRDFPYVLGDPTRLTRVLTNLVSNAIKYTDKGYVELTTRYERTSRDKIVFYVDVVDTGIGIPADKQGVVFQKFVQADSSMTRRFGGTGLGLAITKQLVELMEGKIWLDSAVGEGSAFHVSFPFTTTDKLQERSRQHRLNTQVGIIPPDQARILIAEDHPMNQLFMQKLMEKFGIRQYSIANTGREVLHLAERETWDVILMDCHMPELNGYDATMAIRKLKDKAGLVPIVAMTANAMIGDREKCLRVGMNDYISKPVGIEELRQVLGQWIRFDDIVKTEAAILAPKGSPTALDLSVLHSFTDGNIETERVMISAFIVQSEKSMETLRRHHQGEYSHAWAEAAHMMKGGAGSIGASHLQTLCHDAQHLDAAALDQRAVLYARIVAAYQAVKAGLKKEGLL